VRAFDHVVVESFDGCQDLDGETFQSVIVRPALADGAWPAGEPWPVAVFVNGASQSPFDYYQLLEHVAANGVVIAAFDASLGESVTFRANRLLSFLECVRGTHPDAARLGDRYGLVGHSRGGAAVAVAARAIADGVAAEGVVVDAVVALAPSSDVLDVTAAHTPAYLAIQGSRDPDTRGAALTWFDRAAPDPALIRGLTWIFGATHQRFHQGLLAAGTGELEALLGAEAHWTLARAYVGGFLLWRLVGEDAYREIFEGRAVPPSVAALWPDGPARVFSGFADGTVSRLVVHDFEGDVLSPSTAGGEVTATDLTATSVGPMVDQDAPWSGALASRGLLLRHDGGAPGLSFAIPAAAADFSTHAVLSVRVGRPFDGEASVCTGSSDPVDLELSLSDGAASHAVALSELGPTGQVLVPDHFAPETLGNWVSGECHAVDFLRTVRVPLDRYCEAGVDLTAIDRIELRPRDASGVLFLDDLVLELGEGETPPNCP
jgi:hypothetical protein